MEGARSPLWYPAPSCSSVCVQKEIQLYWSVASSILVYDQVSSNGVFQANSHLLRVVGSPSCLAYTLMLAWSAEASMKIFDYQINANDHADWCY